jgi:large subunit ribosomal protein L10
MANANLEAKKAKVAEVKELINKSKSVVVVDFKGINVAQDTEMRNDFRKNGVTYKVIKNKIVSRAFEELGVKGFDNVFEGPTAVAFSLDDEVSAARIARESSEKFKLTQIKGGYMDGKAMTSDEVKALSYIPGKQQLIANLLGVLTSPVRKLAVVLDQAAKQKA